MTRYYFDLANGDDLIRDDVGVDAGSPAEAFEEAQAALIDMQGNRKAREIGSGWQLVIRDESGMTLSTISLDEAPPISPPSAPQPSYQ